MREARPETHELFDLVKSEADLRRPPAEGFRPILWHLGHIGAFEGYWILQRVKGDPTISPAYDVIFDPIKTPRDDSTNLPAIRRDRKLPCTRARRSIRFSGTLRFREQSAAPRRLSLPYGLRARVSASRDARLPASDARPALKKTGFEKSNIRFQILRVDLSDEMILVPGGAVRARLARISVRV